MIEKLLQHDGTMGLKGACEQPEIRRIPLDVPDPGCAFDADTQEEFQKLRDWERKRPIPDREECERLLAWFHTPEATVRHSRAVAELAVELADRVLKHRSETCVEMTYKSPPIDKHKIYAAALLHDIAKAYPEHPETGAGWLRLLGHTGIADIVADHMDLPAEEKLGYLNESLIVYLADKQVQGERRVTIKNGLRQNGRNLRIIRRRWRVWNGGISWQSVRRHYCKKEKGKSYEINENNRGSRTGTLP